jgi:hypothetical protein
LSNPNVSRVTGFPEFPNTQPELGFLVRTTHIQEDLNNSLYTELSANAQSQEGRGFNLVPQHQKDICLRRRYLAKALRRRIARPPHAKPSTTRHRQ